jgi:preprotein translocase subunit SecG
MQSDCHRCGQIIEGQPAFCPSCGAPQIRVSRAIETSQEETTAASDSVVPASSLPGQPLPFGLSSKSGIDWKYFLRTAIPLAALTDVLTMTLHPLALFVFLPANLVWAISRYRRHRPIVIRSGQGARMGALMGLLSFAFFAAFFLVSISLQRTQYHDLMVSQIQQISAQNPDPQAQQVLQWFTTPDGLIAFTAFALITLLLLCLALGSGSGALFGALRKRNDISG